MRQFLLKTVLACLTLPSVLLAERAGGYAQVDVIPGWRTDAGDHMAGIRIRMIPGWKTYWRAPGDGGIPPEFRFSASDNFRAFTPHWPVPSIFYENGMRSIGYQDEVVFPVTVYTQDADAPIDFAGEMRIGVCAEICIPVTLDFATVLPADGTRDPAIVAALVDQPLSAAEAGVGDVTCTVEPISDGLRVRTSIDVASTGPSEVVVVETADPGIWVSESLVDRDGNSLVATVDMVNIDGQGFALDRSGLRITVLGGQPAIDIHGCDAG